MITLSKNLSRFLISCALLCGAAFGQTATATLSGTVADEKGAVIAGANVTVKNTSTGIERQAVTNENGSFTVPLLPPGDYTVSLNSKGFAPTEIRNVVLNIGSQVSLNAVLKVGDVTGATVDVTAETALIDESATVGTTVDRQFVENIPLNGRSLQSLINLSPGVVLTATDGSSLGQFSVNGQRPNTNYFSIDGVSAPLGMNNGQNLRQGAGGTVPAYTSTGTTQSLISVDAVEEFKIQTSTFAPEFGRSPGAQISIVSRGGGNKFNGSLFEYFRNEKLDANDWFANRVPLTAAQIAAGQTRAIRPPLRQNNFGGTFGGRIIRDKLFFFGNYEGLRLVLPRIVTSTIPNLEIRQQATGAIRQILDSYPIPNGPAVDAQRSLFTANAPSVVTQDSYSLRVDYAFTPRLTSFVRYADSNSYTQSGSFSNNRITSNTQALTANSVWVINSSATNDFRFNVSKTDASQIFFQKDFAGSKAAPDSAFFPTYANSTNSIISFGVSGITGFTLGANGDSKQRQLNILDTFSYIKGSHSFKFGFDYRFLFPFFNPLQHNFSASFSGLTNADGVAVPGTLLSGIATSAQIIHRAEGRTINIQNFSAFAQDTWRANNRLTLTYGVRWDVNPPPKEASGNNPVVLTNLNSGNLSNVGIAPDGTPLFKTTYNNFAPRIGAAYRLFEKPGRETVLRGGFGVFYDIPTSATVSAFSGSSPPYSASRNYSNAPFPYNSPSTPLPSLPAVAPYGSIELSDPELKLPYTLQWNLAVEQSLGANQTVSATYVGALGRRLVILERSVNGIDYTNPLVSAIFVARNFADSDYHALQMQYQRRLSRGFQALSSYTWSHSIDTASTDTIAFFAPGKVPLNTYRGDSDFDIRHTFTAALTYDIPSPFDNKFAKATLGGWSTDLIFYSRSAPVVNVVNFRNVPGLGAFFIFRPDLVPNVPLYIYDKNEPGGRYINRAAFVTPTESRQGTLGRNALRGFIAWQLDFALRREFKLGEKLRLQLKGEMFNILNKPNFGLPQNDLAAGTAFGKPFSMLGRGLNSSNGLSSIYQVGGPRSTQFSLKILF